MPEDKELTRLQSDVTEIKSLVTSIHGRLGKGDVKIAVLEVDVGNLKRIVYGVLGVVLTGVGIAILALVL